MSVYVKISSEMAELMNQKGIGNTFFENQEIEINTFIFYLEKCGLLNKKPTLYYVSK